jgi:NAD(P)-dependent dehydrogenase (short-subunit alcohol dehydrogenase family)
MKLERLKDKVAIITGAASNKGFGYISAVLFAEEGASVVLTDVAVEQVQARVAELRARGFNAIAVEHDVTNADSWNAVLKQTLQAFGRVDVLINNAGIGPFGTVTDTPIETWNRTIAINLTGPFLGCQTIIKQMKLQNSGGSIVNISSTAGLIGMPNMSAYTASKGGIRLFTKSAAMDVAAEGIRINSVHPGVMNTEMVARSLTVDPELLMALVASIPMRRAGEAIDVAAMNLFLASDESRYITGAEFVIDGGTTAGTSG